MVMPLNLLAPAQVGALASDPGGAYAAPAMPLGSGDAGIGVAPARPAAPAMPGSPVAQDQKPEFLGLQQIAQAQQNPQVMAMVAAIAKQYGIGG